ncbi:MAG TPA: nitroreductase family protein [Thermoplasmatales archaeon]|nr:nitroreductase family protein [Thermoplasmatales archaeon]
MELKEAIKKRSSVRKYQDIPVERELIEEFLYYANLAPSAGNLQARDFIIVEDREIKKKLAFASYNQKFIEEAPVVVVFCANLKRISPYGERGKNFYVLQDVACAVQNFLLVAVEKGLSTCWVGAFNDEEVKKILNLPSWVRPVAIVPVGYGDEKSKTDRIDIEKLIHYGRW